MFYSFVIFVDIGQVQAQLHLGKRFQWGIGGNAAVKSDGFFRTTKLFRQLSKLHQDRCALRPQRPRILKVEPHKCLAPAAIECSPDIEKYLRSAVSGIAHQRFCRRSRRGFLAERL